MSKIKAICIEEICDREELNCTEEIDRLVGTDMGGAFGFTVGRCTALGMSEEDMHRAVTAIIKIAKAQMSEASPKVVN